MKLLALLATLLLTHSISDAAILIFEGPAPAKIYGTENTTRRDRATVVYDSTTGQLGIIHFFGKGRSREQSFRGVIAVDGGTISLKRGSITVLSGVSRTAMAEDVDTRMVSFRGKNALLNPSTNLTGPRALSGISRITTRSGLSLTHIEQSFSLVYASKLSNAANVANDTLDDALNRVVIDLENRGYRRPLVN